MGENKQFATISDVLGVIWNGFNASAEGASEILGILDYFIPQKAYDVIIFKFQGGAMAPPCRMLATPLVEAA